MPELGRTAVVDFVRMDIGRWRERRLHLLTVGVLVAMLGLTALGLVGFSAVFAAQTTLAGFVALLTTNAAWVFFSLFALVGLFVAFPIHGEDFSGREASRALFGVLCSRWLLVSASVLVAFLLPLVVGFTLFDEFSLLGMIAVALLTALSVSAYTAIGVSLAAVARSAERLVLWLLVTYWLLVFFWESSLLPLAVGIAVTGEPELAIGTPPLVHDALLAVSPGGAHATLSNAVVGGGFGLVEVVATFALLGWLVVPPAFAWSRLR